VKRLFIFVALMLAGCASDGLDAEATCPITYHRESVHNNRIAMAMILHPGYACEPKFPRWKNYTPMGDAKYQWFVCFNSKAEVRIIEAVREGGKLPRFREIDKSVIKRDGTLKDVRSDEKGKLSSPGAEFVLGDAT